MFCYPALSEVLAEREPSVLRPAFFSVVGTFMPATIQILQVIKLKRIAFYIPLSGCQVDISLSKIIQLTFPIKT